MRVLDFDDWCDKLTDEQLDNIEAEGVDLLSKYDDYISEVQDRAYDELIDERLNIGV